MRNLAAEPYGREGERLELGEASDRRRELPGEAPAGSGRGREGHDAARPRVAGYSMPKAVVDAGFGRPLAESVAGAGGEAVLELKERRPVLLMGRRRRAGGGEKVERENDGEDGGAERAPAAEGHLRLDADEDHQSGGGGVV